MTDLVGQFVELRGLKASDADALVQAASDGELWNLAYTVVPSQSTIGVYVARAIDGKSMGTVVPFVIIARETGQVIGSTRFWKIDRENRRLEIGHTWIAQSWQRTRINTEAKFLMLKHAFDVLACVRVQFTTDVLNWQSRNAILRLGAKEEGTIRNERIMPDGRKRTSVRFSIIDDEWPAVREKLVSRLAAGQRTPDCEV
jgi:N-acetyltransferase